MRAGKLVLGAAALAVAAALVPVLVAQTGAVLHEDFARKLVVALDLEDGQPDPLPAPLAFSILSWRNSLPIPSDAYLRASGVEVNGGAGDRKVVARDPDAEVVYTVSVAKRGDYRLRVEMAGPQPVTGAIRTLKDNAPAAQFTLTPPVAEGWVEAGTTHLDPGVYATSLSLPAGTTVGRLAVAPACLAVVEPPGGWKEKEVLQTDGLAVATLQAVNEEDELPPADAPSDMAASAFRITSPQARVAAAEPEGEDPLRGGVAGVTAQAVVDLTESGRYTVSVFGIAGGGLSFLFDECMKAVVCPPEAAEPGPKWHPMLTSEFTAGRHALTVNLGSGAIVTKVRFEKKKDTPADYAATLQRLGFDPGPLEAPASRAKADEAASFVSDRVKAAPERACGDIGAPVLLAAEPALPAQSPQPPFTGGPTGPPALLPPLDQPPASPVIPLSSGGGS
jgi:hypothetical protein